MTQDLFRQLKAWTWLSSRFAWRRKGLWLRALLCWLIGMAFILADLEHDYDVRLKIRGDQPRDDRIVILMITPEEWNEWSGSQNDLLSWLKESSYVSDSFYWNPKGWEKLFSKLLAMEPTVVGVTAYFGENIPRPPPTVKHSPILNDPRVIWSAQIDDEGRILPSRFAKTYSRNAGVNEYLTDRDGILRRFAFATEPIPHLAVQLSKRLENPSYSEFLVRSEAAPVINFRGSAGHFRTYHLSDFMTDRVRMKDIKDKVVLIGVQEAEGLLYRTPVGEMSRAELSANLSDNILNNRWIQRLNFWQISLLLLAFVILVAWLTSNYPQFLAMFIIFCGNIFYVTCSVWVFDTFYFWLPVLAPAIVSFVTYITFLSFQLTLKEYLTLQLEKERQFLLDVEELKNNFLSLISHDLKTPIAKIQAIVDRIQAQNPQNEFAQDLTSLRVVASELHRYIRTILQIARVEARDFRINKDAADINEIIEAVVQQLETLARAKHITLNMKLEPMFLIEVDHILIHEVILNLIENAIKYTPDGGKVTVSSQEVDERVIIMVEDTGPGIPVEEQARIFEKFYRGELGKSQPKGSGLGLYLVKYFIELHKGRIFLDSQIGVGTKVGFSLPILEVESKAEEDGTTATTDKKTGDSYEAQT